MSCTDDSKRREPQRGSPPPPWDGIDFPSHGSGRIGLMDIHQEALEVRLPDTRVFRKSVKNNRSKIKIK